MFIKLLSIFWLSICSMNSNISMDHNESSNSIDFVEVYDKPSIKKMGSSLQNGIELYMGMADFYAGDYLVTFINNLAVDYPSMEFTNPTNAAIGLSPISGVIFPIVDGDVSSTYYKYINSMIISKTGYQLHTNDSLLDYYTCTYNVFLLYNDTYVVSFWYAMSIPLFDDVNRDLGIQVRACGFNPYGDSTINSLDWIYKEDNRYALCPYIKYLYMPLGYNQDYTYQNGYNDGYSNGYQGGYNSGYNAGANTDATASTIFTGILDVALIPVNVFLTIFNFDVFGINIAGIVSALLTISVVVIIFRFLFGGKKDD